MTNLAIIKETEIREGDNLIADGGFSCMKEKTKSIVKKDENNELYVDCADGTHYLSGQRDGKGSIIGFYKDVQ